MLNTTPVSGARRLLLAIALISLTLACGGPPPSSGGAASAEPRAGGEVVLGTITDVDSWNEYLSRQSFTSNLLRRIYLRLAQEEGRSLEGPVRFSPQLAEEWDRSDDGKTLVFRLRDARWSDGETVTAADVRFTWQAQTSPEVPWIGASSKERIEDVEVIDDRTVAFHFDSAYPQQVADAIDGGIVPEHVFGEVPFADWPTHDWSTARVASGPFVLERHRPGEEAVLVRNPHYFQQGRPFLDRVIVRVIPDIASLLTQLTAGEIDYLEGVTPRDAQRLSRGADVSVVSWDYPKFDYLGWNGAKPPFDDPEIRRAMTLAVDREALIEELLYGHGRVSKGPMPSFRWSAARDLEAWPYDPDEARRILEAHGYATTDADGNARGNGPALELEIMTNQGNRLRADMLVKIQAQLARIGVKVHVQSVEMRALRQRAASGDYDAYLGGWAFTGKVDLKALFGSASAPPRGANVVSYRSPEIDQWLHELDSASSWRAMKPTLDAIQHRIHEDQPYTFLYETRRIAAHGSRLEGVTIDVPSDSLAHLDSFWVHDR